MVTCITISYRSGKLIPSKYPFPSRITVGDFIIDSLSYAYSNKFILIFVDKINIPIQSLFHITSCKELTGRTAGLQRNPRKFFTEFTRWLPHSEAVAFSPYPHTILV
jgi:hypothetical protein